MHMSINTCNSNETMRHVLSHNPSSKNTAWLDFRDCDLPSNLLIVGLTDTVHVLTITFKVQTLSDNAHHVQNQNIQSDNSIRSPEEKLYTNY